MWTLILTLYLSTGWADGGTGVSIHSIDGFSSKELCKVAGKEWLRTTKSKEVDSRSAICVSKLKAE